MGWDGGQQTYYLVGHMGAAGLLHRLTLKSWAQLACPHIHWGAACQQHCGKLQRLRHSCSTSCPPSTTVETSRFPTVVLYHILKYHTILCDCHTAPWYFPALPPTKLWPQRSTDQGWLLSTGLPWRKLDMAYTTLAFLNPHLISNGSFLWKTNTWNQSHIIIVCAL